MTKQKQQEIIKWMCKHWKSEDVFDDAVQHFGTSKEVLDFCAELSKKIDKALKTLPSYLEKELKK